MPLFTSIGAIIGGSALAAGGAAAAAGVTAFGVGVAATAVAAGAVAYSQTAGKAPKMEVPKLPKTPTIAAASEAAKSQTAAVGAKKKAIARNQSVYTSPLGIAGEAQIAKKTLLGQ